MKKEKTAGLRKIALLEQQCSALQARRAESSNLILTAEERAQEVENILEVYEKQHDQLKMDLDKQKIKRLDYEKELRDLQNDKEIAELEVKSITKEQAKIRSKWQELKELLQKKEDILYHR